MKFVLNCLLLIFCSFGMTYASFASGTDGIYLDFAEIYEGGEIAGKDDVCDLLKRVKGIRYITFDSEISSVDSDIRSLDGDEHFMDIQSVQIYTDPFGRNVKPLGMFMPQEHGIKIIESYDVTTGELTITDKGVEFSAHHMLKLVEFEGENVLMFKIVEDSEDIYGYFVLD